MCGPVEASCFGSVSVFAVGSISPVAELAAVAAQAGVSMPTVSRVLNRRSDRVLAGATVPRSRAHLAYVAAEAVKVAALVTCGVLAS